MGTSRPVIDCFLSIFGAIIAYYAHIKHMKKMLLGLLLALSAGAAAAQSAPTATFKQAFAAGQTAEEAEHWEQAEASYAICLAQAPTDTTVLKNHAYAATNSLVRHAGKPDGAPGQVDYLPLAVKDYDALVAIGRVRYLLDKAVAYGTRADASVKAERATLLEQALAAVREYEKRAKPDSDSRQVRGALLTVMNKSY
jgi:hypothetical protein